MVLNLFVENKLPGEPDMDGQVAHFAQTHNSHELLYSGLFIKRPALMRLQALVRPAHFAAVVMATPDICA